MKTARVSLLAAAVMLCGSLSAAEAARDLQKDYDELTSAEKTAARRAGKEVFEKKTLGKLNVCADPGNMPLSDINRNGYQNKIAEVIAKALGADLVYFWRPYLERGLTRETFETNVCDVLLDLPADYGLALTTFPIYRTTYVFAYRNDRGFDFKGFDDPALKSLKIGVFQTSGVREVLTEARPRPEPEAAHPQPQRRLEAREPALAAGAGRSRWQARRGCHLGAVRRLGAEDEGRADRRAARQLVGGLHPA